MEEYSKEDDNLIYEIGPNEKILETANNFLIPMATRQMDYLRNKRVKEKELREIKKGLAVKVK